MAFLHNGEVSVGGKLTDIKTRYRGRDYYLELLESPHATILVNQFPLMRQLGENQLVFNENDYALHDVLTIVTTHRIPLVKLERIEPTLESLFMEVIEK